MGRAGLTTTGLAHVVLTQAKDTRPSVPAPSSPCLWAPTDPLPHLEPSPSQNRAFSIAVSSFSHFYILLKFLFLCVLPSRTEAPQKQDLPCHQDLSLAYGRCGVNALHSPSP